MKVIKPLQSLILLPLIIIMMAGSCGKQTYQKTEGIIWNTLFHISYKGSPNLEDSILKVFEEVSASLNVFDSTSLTSMLNRSDSILADEHLLSVYRKSKEINKLSQGLFDPTISPLITAWGFGIGHVANSDTTAIDSILQFVGIEKTKESGNFIVKDDSRLQFNFSAIAKGYGCDAIGEMFRRNGVEDFMVEVGGELCLKGESSSGGPWKIAIDAPIEDLGAIHQSAFIIGITDKGIATSGNYRNYRKDGGNTLAHTISPKTGRPYLSQILSATVIAETCMEADALATACMASTPPDAKNLLEIYGAEGLFIFADSVYMTPGFKNYIIGESSEPGRKGQN